MMCKERLQKDKKRQDKNRASRAGMGREGAEEKNVRLRREQEKDP